MVVITDTIEIKDTMRLVVNAYLLFVMTIRKVKREKKKIRKLKIKRCGEFEHRKHTGHSDRKGKIKPVRRS